MSDGQWVRGLMRKDFEVEVEGTSNNVEVGVGVGEESLIGKCLGEVQRRQGDDNNVYQTGVLPLTQAIFLYYTENCHRQCKRRSSDRFYKGRPESTTSGLNHTIPRQ